MYHEKFSATVLSFLLLFTLFASNVTADSTQEGATDDSSGGFFLGIPLPPDVKLIDFIPLIPFYVLRNVLGSPFYVLRFSEPETFIATPNVIDIEYLNQTEIIIGAIDTSTGEYISFEEYSANDLFPSEDYEFKLEMPDYLPKDAFIAHFSPQSLVVEKGDIKLKSTLLITSNIPKEQILPESIRLRVNITKYLTAGNLFLPPRPFTNRIPIISPIITGFQRFPLLWLCSSLGLLGGAPFGLLYSGKRTPEDPIYVDVIVKINRFHLVDISPVKTIEIGPDELTTIPIEIHNLGSHEDCFNFRVTVDSDDGLLISPPPAVTLGPGETFTTYIGVATPQIFNDPGTARSLTIEAYSIYSPNKVFTNTATIVTRGFYISDVSGFYSVIIIIVILVVVCLFLFRRKRFVDRNCMKPEKPWSLPEEKKYLEELRNQDKKQYDETLLLMTEEYQSALLWYKNYKKHLLLIERRDKILPRIYSGFLHKIRSLTKKSDEKKIEPSTVQSKKQREHIRLSLAWPKKKEPKEYKETTSSSPKERKTLFANLLKEKNGLDQIDEKLTQPSLETESGLARGLTKKKEPLPLKEPTVKQKTGKIDLERERALKKIKRAQEKQRARKLNM